jgi:hypothetical protein
MPVCAAYILWYTMPQRMVARAKQLSVLERIALPCNGGYFSRSTQRTSLDQWCVLLSINDAYFSRSTMRTSPDQWCVLLSINATYFSRATVDTALSSTARNAGCHPLEKSSKQIAVPRLMRYICTTADEPSSGA